MLPVEGQAVWGFGGRLVGWWRWIAAQAKACPSDRFDLLAGTERAQRVPEDYVLPADGGDSPVERLH